MKATLMVRQWLQGCSAFQERDDKSGPAQLAGTTEKRGKTEEISSIDLQAYTGKLAR